MHSFYVSVATSVCVCVCVFILAYSKLAMLSNKLSSFERMNVGQLSERETGVVFSL